MAACSLCDQPNDSWVGAKLPASELLTGTRNDAIEPRELAPALGSRTPRMGETGVKGAKKEMITVSSHHSQEVSTRAQLGERCRHD